ncbi:GNAT family N-acetyltransferase [Flavivirga sp. 57AJ16]|uniref:GNAT family N-acetyltransferase n=1 Tax=Flavivirga sp. 57AJ16 TaxID=3025307 RepID=UPI00236506F7|nr:GNAT family N-acetyltransferase [Flavivirga sp. 57AJ16]MDD7885841.1 GNAT family N-acetyltransferase [Flavivirga sp. 57AJ16]
MSFLKREQFIWNFIKENKTPSCYNEILFKSKNYKLPYANGNEGIKADTTYVSLFPSLFEPLISNENLFHFKRKRHVGLSSVAIINEGYEDAEDYLKKLKSSTRSSLRKRIKRVDSCFDIQYKMFYGSISKDEHASIMNELREMLIARFEQKNMKNEILSDFSDYKNATYHLIKDKKASLFVVYNTTKPIGISLNYHVDKLFYGTIMTYDIDYSKFAVGNLLIYKQLDWVLKNNYLLFDMGNGESNYKRTWSNTVYDYEYHLVFKKKSIIARIVAYIEIMKIDIKNYIKILKEGPYIQKLKNNFIKTNNNSPDLGFKISKVDGSEIIPMTSLETINLNENIFSSLRKPVYDFLYTSKQHLNSINIYSIKTEENNYLIKGPTETGKINLSKL